MTPPIQPGGVLAWHFVAARLRDGRPVPADGETLTHTGPIVWCESGLYGSERIMDALSYAPGDTVCRVEMWDVAENDSDKLVACNRRILWRVEAAPVLRHFARLCALDVAHLWAMPDVVRRYLDTGDENLRVAAWAAAWAAARDGAQDAARAAARAAAWAVWAARDAWDASQEAARAARGAARRDVARDAQEARLVAMIEAARGVAA